MPRAEPALSLAPLPLPAVVGAAIRTAITTPVPPSGPPPQSGGLTPEGCPARKRGQGVLPTPLTPSGPPPQSGGHGQGALGAGAVPGQPPSGYPRESPGAFLVLLHAHCYDSCTLVPMGQRGAQTHDGPDRRSSFTFSSFGAFPSSHARFSPGPF